MDNDDITEHTEGSTENVQAKASQVAKQFDKKPRSLYVANLPLRLKVVDLTEYFSKYGTVRNSFFTRKGCAIVTFATQDEAQCALHVPHTIQGRELRVKLVKPRSAEKRHKWMPQPKKPFVWSAQWDYFDPHKRIMDQLEKCQTVPEQIQTFCDAVSLTKNDDICRQEVLQDLENVLRKYYPQCILQILGSTAIGHASGKSYFDVYFEPVPTYSIVHQNRQQSGKEVSSVCVPSITDLEKGTVSQDSLRELPPHVHIQLVRNVLCNHLEQFRCFHLMRRVRHIKFNHRKTGIGCNLKVGARPYLCSTELLKLYAALDDRFLPLMKILRYWACFRGIVQLRNLSSYPFSLMVVFFLQNTDPPVLPTIEELQNVPGPDAGEWEYDFCYDVNKIEKSKNTQTIESLVVQFFSFYEKFDYSHIICPLTGQKKLVTKSENSLSAKLAEGNALFIENPFNPTEYTSPYFRFQRLKVLKHAMRKASKSYKVSSDCTGGGWGLMQLFESQRDVYEVPVKYFPKSRDSVSFSFELSRKLQSYLINEPADFFKRLSSLLLDTFDGCLLHDSEVVDMLEVESLPSAPVKSVEPSLVENSKTENEEVVAGASSPEELDPKTEAGVWNKEFFSPETKNFKPLRVVLIQSTATYDTWTERRRARASRLGKAESCHYLFRMEQAKSEWLVDSGLANLKHPAFYSCDCHIYRLENQDRLLFTLSPYEGFQNFSHIGFFLKALIWRVLDNFLDKNKVMDDVDNDKYGNDRISEEPMET